MQKILNKKPQLNDKTNKRGGKKMEKGPLEITLREYNQLSLPEKTELNMRAWGEKRVVLEKAFEEGAYAVVFCGEKIKIIRIRGWYQRVYIFWEKVSKKIVMFCEKITKIIKNLWGWSYDLPEKTARKLQKREGKPAFIFNRPLNIEESSKGEEAQLQVLSVST